jgi:myosin heavy subunit
VEQSTSRAKPEQRAHNYPTTKRGDMSVGFLNEIAELGEEEALDLLERRYYDQIFSFRLGQVFYTINPWQKSAKRYQDFLQLTDQEKSDDLWSIPDCSLRELNNSSQSILFLGESGSG